MSKCWQGTETPAVGTAHHFHFLLGEIRDGVWLVWHRNCQDLTLQSNRSENHSCCLPWGTQELVPIFEIQGLSINKKESYSRCWKTLESSLDRFQCNTKKFTDFGPFFCKNHGGILQSLHWFGILFYAVRLHCLQQSEIGLRRWC